MLKQQEIDQESGLPEPMADVERYMLETQREARPRRVEIPELLQERRAVILGDPGAGKTTLLRYVAYTLARSNVPIRSRTSSSIYLTWLRPYQCTSALASMRSISRAILRPCLMPLPPLPVRHANCP